MLRRSSLRALASPSYSRATLPPSSPARWRTAPPGASLRPRRVGALRASPLLRLGPQRASVLKTDYYQIRTTLTCCRENTNVFLQVKAVFSLSFSPSPRRAPSPRAAPNASSAARRGFLAALLVAPVVLSPRRAPLGVASPNPPSGARRGFVAAVSVPGSSARRVRMLRLTLPRSRRRASLLSVARSGSVGFAGVSSLAPPNPCKTHRARSAFGSFATCVPLLHPAAGTAGRPADPAAFRSSPAIVETRLQQVSTIAFACRQ